MNATKIQLIGITIALSNDFKRLKSPKSSFLNFNSHAKKKTLLPLVLHALAPLSKGAVAFATGGLAGSILNSQSFRRGCAAPPSFNKDGFYSARV